MTKPHVLAVDDDPINLMIISEILESADVELTCTDGGEAALHALESHRPPFSLVILDRMMPGVDGFEVLRRMKRSNGTLDMPVIMQTAAARPDEIAEGLRAGAYYYLTKPYAPDALRVIVRAALEQPRVHQSVRPSLTTLDGIACALTDAQFNFRTLADVERLVNAFAPLCANEGGVGLGLRELMVNAVEHGNLAISYAEKTALKRADRWEAEIEARLGSEQYVKRNATLRVQRNGNSVKFTISDAGEGFDFHRYLDFDPERAFDPNGRGVALANKAGFKDLAYQGKGNVVMVTAEYLAPSHDSQPKLSEDYTI